MSGTKKVYRSKRKSVEQGEFYVEGFSAVAEYVRYAPQSLRRISAKKHKLEDVEKLLSTHNLNIPVNVIEADSADVAVVKAVVRHTMGEWESLKNFISNDPSYNRLLVLDQVTDTRNLGAIARSAAFFGCKAVVVLKRRQTLLTQAAVQTAQGGFALIDFVAVTNLSRAMEELKALGFWCAGAEMAGQDVASVRKDYEKLVLVLGAEDHGLSENVRKRCDFFVKIPGAEKLDSLNVSVAAGILLHEFSPKL